MKSEIATLNSLAEVIKTNSVQIEESYSKARAFGLAYTQIPSIETEEQDQEFVTAYKKIKATKDKIENLRKAFTSPLDDIKKEYINREKELTAICEVIKGKRDERANRLFQEEQAKLAKIQAEKEVKIAIAEETARLKAALESLPDDLLNQTVRFLNDTLSANDLGQLQTLKAKLSLTPKLKEDVYNRIFQTTETTVSGQPVSFTELHQELKKAYPFEALNQKYIGAATATLDEYKSKIEAKILELKAVEAMNEAEREKQKARLAEEAAKAKAEAEEADRKRKEEIEAKAKAEAEAAKLEAEFQAQIETQQGESAHVKGSQVKYTAKVKKMTAYADLIAYYISQGGDLSKLEFLATFAAKNGRPEINGVVYESEIKTSAR